MCGFCGLLMPETHATHAERIARMNGSIAHRGPDAEGTWIGDGVSLAHRRLSIIDLSATGAQPMSGQSGTTIVYNGEAYNFLELKHELEKVGVAFRGTSDTEVILNAYEEWGLDGLKRIEGMFALALWDPRRKRLVLMRDRLGIKPLFYGRRGASIAFGSEIKVVLAAQLVDRDVDPQAFSEYLWYGNAFEDRTIYRDVRAVPPGHWLIVEQGNYRLEPWWTVEEWLREDRARLEAADAISMTRAALDAAVARQLVSDVPIGIFLSGGVDSSSIGASAVRASSRRLSSYSVGFDFDRGINELPKARAVANLLGLDHHELRISATDLPDVLLALVRAHDEPFADAANIPLFMLGRALGGSLKVVLQGDGGDEMFAGYRRYAIVHHAAAWRSVPKPIAGLAYRFGGSRGVRFARMVEAAGSSSAALRMALLLTVETLRDPPTAMLGPEARRELEANTDPFAAYKRCAARFERYDPVQQMLLTDITLQLPSQFLTKVDRATMAQGLEVRVPLLDERIGELVVGMNPKLKVRGVEKKIVLRDAMRERLPAEILDGPKTGFGVPYEHWLRTSLFDFARDAVLDDSFVRRFGLDKRSVEIALEEHRTGRRERGFLLWKLMQAALWTAVH